MQAARSWLCHAEVRDFEAWMQNVRSAAQTQASELARSPSWQALGQTSHSQFSHAEIYITPPLLLIIGAVALSQACESARKNETTSFGARWSTVVVPAASCAVCYFLAVKNSGLGRVAYACVSRPGLEIAYTKTPARDLRVPGPTRRGHIRERESVSNQCEINPVRGTWCK